MEYSLQYLNQIAQLKNLKLSDIVNQLNLIGFEVDEIFYEKSNLNPFADNIRLLMKIPANREDLLNETFLLTDLSTILAFPLNQTWFQIKRNYSFLLKDKYQKNLNYDSNQIFSEVSNVLVYNVELKNIKINFSPIWIQNKLKNSNLQITNTLEDVLTLITFEWGQSFEFLNLTKNSSLSLKRITKGEKFLNRKNIQFEDLKEGTIVLVDDQNEILSCLGSIHFDSSMLQKEKLNLNAIFYDIHENPLTINPLEQSFSLRFLRKTFLQNFKFSFQRLLTLLELCYSIEILPTIYSTLESSISIESKKILKLTKNSAKKFLNMDHYDLSIFKQSGLKIICNTPNELYFQIPNSRNDLQREIDLIEEYSRFIGYKNFSIILPIKRSETKKKENIVFIKEYFIENGFNEVITNPIREINIKDSVIQIINPLRAEFSSLRTELLSELIKCYTINYRLMLETKSIFEVGRVFTRKNSFGIHENDKLAGIFRLKIEADSSEINWIRAQGIIERFFYYFNSHDLKIEKEINKSSNEYLHPTRSIKYLVKNKIIGIFGELNPTFKITRNEQTFAFELNLENLEEWKKEGKVQQIKEFSKYPLVIKDLSLLIYKNSTKNLSELISKACSSINIYNFEIFDIYIDHEKIHKEEVNIGLRIYFQSKIKTLTSQELDLELLKIMESLTLEGNIQLKEKR